MPFPYVMALHQAPTDGGDYGGFHFHIEFHPPLRRPNLLKYLAGPEIGGGNFLSDTSPEEKAAELRARPTVHYERPRRDRAAAPAARADLRALHDASATRSSPRASAAALEHLAAASRADDEGDTIYAIDRVSEDVLVEYFERRSRRERRSCSSRKGCRAAGGRLPAGHRWRTARSWSSSSIRSTARAGSCTRSGRRGF